MEPDPKEVQALLIEKYQGVKSTDFEEDVERLRSGEPLAYVIGHIPFLGLSLALDSRPLIPRPETEWWTELLIERLRLLTTPTVLDLCAGSGAIGAAVLHHTDADVWFSELSEADADQIGMNIERNALPKTRSHVVCGDLFAPIGDKRFDVIATNPPYIPEGRELSESVTRFEPPGALFAGSDGLAVIRRIAEEAPAHLTEGGELWMECDITNIREAARLLGLHATRTDIRTDPYDRPRLVVAYY